MNLAIQEPVQEANSLNLTVSGDGSWITGGRASAHGIADLCSTITKPQIKDINHYAKWLSNRCKNLKDWNKNKILKDGLKISGPGRLTEKHIIKFKIYLSSAIRKNKTNLSVMFQNSQAIFYHYYSTNEDPQHHFCGPKWCKYLQDKVPYDHDQHSLPRAFMDIIRPAFNALCSKDALKKVVNGGSKNSNETFHGIL
ncbi:unnamed protein product [Rotaria sp. Silwood2]|nr:unnamed protein product [Rotaria sp. Silwood2]CAF4393539.1 unnamed protein product [Rotaria sp. Silwood2]